MTRLSHHETCALHTHTHTRYPDFHTRFEGMADAMINNLDLVSSTCMPTQHTICTCILHTERSVSTEAERCVWSTCKCTQAHCMRVVCTGVCAPRH